MGWRKENLGKSGMIVQVELRGENEGIERRQIDNDAGRSPIRSWHREYPGLETGLVGNRVNDTLGHPVLDRQKQVWSRLGVTRGP